MPKNVGNKNIMNYCNCSYCWKFS